MRNERTKTSAIVVGAGMAGLVTARVLSEHCDRVTIIERDPLTGLDGPRRGAPQGRHAHVLLALGHKLLEGWFPGLTRELIDRGAIPVPTKNVVWYQGGGYRRRVDLGIEAISMSRPLLESTVRRQLLRGHQNVVIDDDTPVRDLILRGNRVVGVRVDGGELRADLVVDCSGRDSRLLRQLETAGFPSPEVSEIRIDMAYGTRIVGRRPGDFDSGGALVIGDPKRGHRMGTLLPIEDDRWIVTVAGFHGDAPPTDAEGFEEFARSLPSGVIADVMASADKRGDVMTHRMVASRRRHVESLPETAPGFLVLGDAICSFNPVYGQGMTSAALQARELGKAIRRNGLRSSALAPSFYGRAARVVDVPWRIAAGADFAHPCTTGPKPFGTDLVNRYMAKVFQACHTSVSVTRQITRVQNLLARPETLMTPAMAVRVWAATRGVPGAADLRPPSEEDRPVDRVASQSAVPPVFVR